MLDKSLGVSGFNILKDGIGKFVNKNVGAISIIDTFTTAHYIYFMEYYIIDLYCYFERKPFNMASYKEFQNTPYLVQKYKKISYDNKFKITHEQATEFKTMISNVYKLLKENSTDCFSKKETLSYTLVAFVNRAVAEIKTLMGEYWQWADI